MLHFDVKEFNLVARSVLLALAMQCLFITIMLMLFMSMQALVLWVLQCHWGLLHFCVLLLLL